MMGDVRIIGCHTEVVWLGARLSDCVTRAGGAIRVHAVWRFDFARSSLDDGGWAMSQKPGDGAVGDGALVAGRRWRHVRFLGQNEVPWVS